MARRRHAPKLKARVVLEVVAGDRTPGQIANAHGVQPNSVGLKSTDARSSPQRDPQPPTSHLYRSSRTSRCSGTPLHPWRHACAPIAGNGVGAAWHGAPSLAEDAVGPTAPGTCLLCSGFQMVLDPSHLRLSVAEPCYLHRPCPALLMPGAGLEPARAEAQRFLRPPRLPLPPPRRSSTDAWSQARR